MLNWSSTVRFCEDIPHRFPSNRSIPHSIGSPASEFGRAAILSSATVRLTEDSLEVPTLGTEPAADEHGWVFAECSIEGMPGFGMQQALDHKRQLIVKST